MIKKTYTHRKLQLSQIFKQQKSLKNNTMQCKRGTWRQSCTPPECGHEVKGECVKVAVAGKGPASRGAYIRQPENVSILRTKYVSEYRNGCVGGSRLPFYCGIRYVYVGLPFPGSSRSSLTSDNISAKILHMHIFHVPCTGNKFARCSLALAKPKPPARIKYTRSSMFSQ